MVIFRDEHDAMSETRVLQIFDDCNAIWFHDGTLAPHARLTSGKCSNGFVKWQQVAKHVNLCEIIGRALYQRIRAECTSYTHNEAGWVIAPANSAITVSYVVAKEFTAYFGYVTKDPSDKEKMVWDGGVIDPKLKVLLMDDVITTRGSIDKARKALEDKNPEKIHFLPIVACVVHRPPKLPVSPDGIKVVSLIEREIWAVNPEDCPLCKKGSIPLAPKSHWAQLTGKK